MLEEYLHVMKTESGLSSNTVLSYQYDLEAFQAYLRSLGVEVPEAICQAHIVSYLLFLKRSGKAAATILRTAASLKRYCAFLLRRGILSEDPCQDVTLPKLAPRDTLPPDRLAVEKLLEQIDSHSVKGKRDRAMVSLVAATGMQASELLALDVTHFRPEASLLQVPKVRGEQYYPLPEALCLSLQLYLQESRPHLARQEEPALFVNFAGQRMSRQGFWKIVNAYGTKAQLDQSLSPRNLRYTLLG